GTGPTSPRATSTMRSSGIVRGNVASAAPVHSWPAAPEGFHPYRRILDAEAASADRDRPVTGIAGGACRARPMAPHRPAARRRRLRALGMAAPFPATRLAACRSPDRSFRLRINAVACVVVDAFHAVALGTDCPGASLDHAHRSGGLGGAGVAPGVPGADQRAPHAVAHERFRRPGCRRCLGGPCTD